MNVMKMYKIDSCLIKITIDMLKKPVSHFSW